MTLSSKKKQYLKNKYSDWAIVTRASSGIGLELETQLAGAGFNLIINARNQERLFKAEESLQKGDISIRSVIADPSESEGVAKIIEASSGLKVGLLINNAGFGTSGLFFDSSLHSEINVLRLNCESALALTHHFSRQFKKQGSVGIIFLSSLAAFQGCLMQRITRPQKPTFNHSLKHWPWNWNHLMSIFSLLHLVL